MLLNFRETVEAIAKERGAYISSNDDYAISKLEDGAGSVDEAITKIKELKEIRLKFKAEDYSKIKRAVSST